MSAYNSELITHYQKLSRLGSGTYGTVYKARDRRTGEIVAIKKLRLTNEQSGFHLTSLREITLLQTTVHRNIVLLKDVVVGRRPDFVVLVFEFCEYDLGTLLDRTTRRFAVSEVKTLLQQLLRGIEYLHERGIVHRDIKLSNLLVSARGELKIADFGLARRLPFPLAPMSPTVFTLWYRAPELLLASPVYHAAADMWAVGCIMGELLLHRPLLPGGSETEQMVLISQLLGPPSAIDWPGFAALASHPRAAAALALDPAGPNYSRLAEEFQALSGAGLDLLSRLLAYDPARRITAAQAAIHPWFQEAPAPCPLHKMPVFKPQDIAQAPAQQQQQQQQQQQAPRQAQPHHEDGGGDI
jgi:cyclin-dependent kinase 10